MLVSEEQVANRNGGWGRGRVVALWNGRRGMGIGRVRGSWGIWGRRGREGREVSATVEGKEEIGLGVDMVASRTMFYCTCIGILYGSILHLSHACWNRVWRAR